MRNKSHFSSCPPCSTARSLGIGRGAVRPRDVGGVGPCLPWVSQHTQSHWACAWSAFGVVLSRTGLDVCGPGIDQPHAQCAAAYCHRSSCANIHCNTNIHLTSADQHEPTSACDHTHTRPFQERFSCLYGMHFITYRHRLTRDDARAREVMLRRGLGSAHVRCK